MAINETNFTDNIWNYTFKAWTNLFNNYVGNGNIFFIFPLIIVTMGIYVKTENPVLTSMFMISSGAVLGFGTLSAGIPDLPLLFVLFAAMGLVPLFTFIFFGD